MTDLLARLGPVDDRLALRPASPALGPLGAFIVDAVDAEGQLVLYDLKTDESTSADQLLLRGRARVLSVETSVKARFQFRDGALESFVLIAEPPTDWRIVDSFPDLSPFVDGARAWRSRGCPSRGRCSCWRRTSLWSQTPSTR